MPKPQVIILGVSMGSAEDTYGRLLRSSGLDWRKAKKVGIKVNLCDYRMAESGATTDPALLEALIRALRKINPDIVIHVWENDATSVEVRSLVACLGFHPVLERTGTEFLSFAEGEWEKVPVPGGEIFTEMELPKALRQVDAWVNFTKLKTNGITKTTGCLKNNFAFLRTKKKSVFHGNIDPVLVDINRVVRADFHIVDGFIGMEGEGPAFGIPKKCGLLIGGVDPVAVDACCARIMGFSPAFVRHIRLADRAGLGSMRYRLETDIPSFRYRDYRFRFSRIEFELKKVLRKMTYLGAAG